MSTKKQFRVALRGSALLNSPRFNKGTAFSEAERNEFGLVGRLPSKINTIDEQVSRVEDQLDALDTAIRKNVFLQSLRDQNWVLYYTVMKRNLVKLLPVAYTPTEAEAISNYSHLFRRSEGLYLSYIHRDTMERDYLEQTKDKKVDLVVCSDAQAILGIGDQGVGGIGISTAKAMIYTLIGGVDPSKALPVTLDVGTDNKDLLNDPLYVGWQEKRVTGDEYDKFIDQFVQIVRKHNPHCLLHFEDFGVANAERLLERYRDYHAVFNDDIQGTGAVTLAAVMAAVGVTRSKLSEQRFIVYGAGSAGLGIVKQLRDAVISLDKVSKEEANAKFFLVDKYGLIKESLGPDKIRSDLQEFVRSDNEWKDVAVNERQEIELLEVVKKVKPTVLIGCSTHAGGFTKEVVTVMAEDVDRPIILPLSNPSKLVEVEPQYANEWTKGKALIATGSPFPPVKLLNGNEYVISECNNALIYPGIGFGAIISKSRIITDTMIIAAAQRLAALSPALTDPDNPLLPDFADAYEVNYEVAVAVAEQAIKDGVANVNWSDEEVRKNAKEIRWEAEYGEYIYDEKGGK